MEIETGRLTYFAFASSSDGNAGVVSDGRTHLLLDAGISAARIRDGLGEIGLDPRELSALLVTHLHEDHVKGAKVFLKKTPLPVLRLKDAGGTGGIKVGSWPFPRPTTPRIPAASGLRPGTIPSASPPTSAR